MLVRELGPKGIFARFRNFLAKKQTSVGGLFDMFSCVGCVSMYVGFLTALLVSGSVLQLFMYTLSFSALTKLIDALLVKKS